ncbi:hypothetical protein [Halobiforma nitratireducens]|uniref:Uncharacterized protein n=1 Tax=Halobiforma nitratireducens JCM 10879 TaxID=1227454 RepID=M0MET4_9EURY|nr:hypothetical protein [Halobiforma nitratireducens]EMA42920.1 hypothetical protein C446_03701 [Halobiforma nitratireducens JCM 10879]
MSVSRLSDLNEYGVTAVLCVVASAGTLFLGGTSYWYLSAVLFGLAAVTVLRAMRIKGDPDEYPHDRESANTDRQTELEGEKGGVMGEQGL